MGGCDTSVRLIKSQTEEEEGTPLPLLWQLTACDIIHRIKALTDFVNLTCKMMSQSYVYKPTEGQVGFFIIISGCVDISLAYCSNFTVGPGQPHHTDQPLPQRAPPPRAAGRAPGQSG